MPEPASEPVTERVTEPVNDAERLRRPEPARTGPIRNATGYFRRADSWDVQPGRPLDVWATGGTGDDVMEHAMGPGEDAPQGGDADSEAAQGVRLGYQVIEEHIRQGRNTARAFRKAAADDTGADFGDLLTRALHVYQDAGSLVLDFIEHLAGNPVLLSALSRARRKPSAPPSQSDAQPVAPGPEQAAEEAARRAAEQTSLAGVELATRRPARASTQLHPCATPYAPQVPALRAADPQTRPLTDIRFIPQPNGQGMLLRIEIPDDQPPGTYTGVIIDAETEEPRGTVCVRIDD